jgi:hypothetical protein
MFLFGLYTRISLSAKLPSYLRRFRSVSFYLKKYILKCAEYSHDDQKAKRTLAMCWIFRKKAFYVSGQFRKALSDLIRLSCSSKTNKIQVDLFENELRANSWRVLGFVGASILDLEGDVWTIEFKREQINACFAEWESANVMIETSVEVKLTRGKA